MKLVPENLNESKKKKIKKLKAGSVADPTMPILIPKNNAKMFKSMQKSIGLKPFNKGAELKETNIGVMPVRRKIRDLVLQVDANMHRFNERINGLINIEDNENTIEKLINIKNDLLQEGYDKEDIKEYYFELIKQILKH